MSDVKPEELQPHEVWSSNNEVFDCDSLDELLCNMVADEIPKAGDVVYVGDAIPPKLSELVEADMVIDGIIDRAFDYAGEYADNYPDCSKEEKQELQQLLEAWLAKVDTPRFYIIKNSRQYILTAEDVAPFQEAA